MLDGFPTAAPPPPVQALVFADVAVTATANEFAGIYRGKPCHASDFDAVLDRAVAAGVRKILLTGMHLVDVPVNLALAQAHPGHCYVTMGVHPYHAAEPDEAGEDVYFGELAQAIDEAVASSSSGLAALGELGLDYDRLDRCGRDAQLRTFRRQLDLAVTHAWDLPLFLHCRAAFDDFVAVLTEYQPRLQAVRPAKKLGLVHSFVGTAAQMQALVALGLDVGVNGFSFQDAASLQMVRAIPLDYLQLETDAPWGDIPANSAVAQRYLVHAPAPPLGLPAKKRQKFELGKMVKDRHESCCIARVAYIVAGLRGVAVEEVTEAAWTNSTQMFGLGV